MKGILPKLTISSILAKVSEEEIFERYFNVRVVEGVMIKVPSVIRQDNNPTGMFYRKGFKLKFKDFMPNSFSGDCFDAVAHCLNLNIRNKQDFYLVLLDIAGTFNLYGYNSHTIRNTLTATFRNKQKLIIEVYTRPYNKLDREYWESKGRNVTEQLLTYFGVYFADKIYVTKNGVRTLVYYYKTTDPCYAYYLGESEGSPDWRLYYPCREIKFFTNNSRPQGLNQLMPARFGLITKSLKDVISLYTYGITSYAPAAEGIHLTKRVVNYAHSYADYWGTLFDYDNAGIRASRFYWENYRYTRYFLTDKAWNRKKGLLGAKDFSQFNDLHGVDKTINLVKSVTVPLIALEEHIREYEQRGFY